MTASRFLAKRPAHLGRRVAAIVAAGVLVAGCASADKTPSTSSSTAASSGATLERVRRLERVRQHGGHEHGRQLAARQAAPSVDGIKPVPTQPLGRRDVAGDEDHGPGDDRRAVRGLQRHQRADGQARPEDELSPDGDAQRRADRACRSRTPSVWATITKAGKIVYDERQWPMISRYMGPHYGNDVVAPGRRQLSAQPAGQPAGVGAPRRVPERLAEARIASTLTFHWKPVA